MYEQYEMYFWGLWAVMGASFAIHHYAIVTCMDTTLKYWKTDSDENLLEMDVIVKTYSLNRWNSAYNYQLHDRWWIVADFLN